MINLSGFFHGVVHAIETAEGIAQPILADIAAVPSPIQPLATTLLSAMEFLETWLPANGSGPARKPFVISLVNAAHPNVNQAQLSIWIDDLVTTGNAFQSVIAKVRGIQ